MCTGPKYRYSATTWGGRQRAAASLGAAPRRSDGAGALAGPPLAPSGVPARGRTRASTGLHLISHELFQEIRRLEVLGYGVVQPRDHFIDRFLPRLFSVLSTLDRLEELPQGLLDHVPEILRNLSIPSIRSATIPTLFSIHEKRRSVNLPLCDCFGCNGGSEPCRCRSHP